MTRLTGRISKIKTRS